MLPHELQNIVPEPTPTAEIFQRHQVVREFYDEVKYRQEFELYCQWYYATAKQHQQELQKMQGDFNIFAAFRRGLGILRAPKPAGIVRSNSDCKHGLSNIT